MTFSTATIAHMDTLDLAERKKQGQYMTPAALGDAMVEALNLTDAPEGAVILDPAVGTGELLLAVRRATTAGVLRGYDVDGGMRTPLEENVPEASFERISLFDQSWRGREGTVDFIIANPPYFEMKKDDPLLQGVADFSTLAGKGRLNIYSLFFEYALRLLKEQGRMVFLVPPSMNNGAYFKQLRNTILDHGRITHLTLVRENNLFSDALTSAQIIVIEKTTAGREANMEASHPYTFATYNDFIITDNRSGIEAYWGEGKKSLHDLGFTVKTGPIPWNQYKGQFVAEGEGLPLLYSKDITSEHKLVLSEKIPAERRYLPASLGKQLTAPAIIVNRVVGSLARPSLKFAYVSENSFAENHVNVIQHADVSALEALFTFLEELDPAEVASYLQALTGNTQLSATELLHLVPVAEASII